MPRCHNVPKSHKPVYYTGHENTPRRHGWCAKHEKEGQLRKGKYGNMYRAHGERWIPADSYRKMHSPGKRSHHSPRGNFSKKSVKRRSPTVKRAAAEGGHKIKMKTAKHAVEKIDKSEYPSMVRHLKKGKTLRRSMHHAMKGDMTKDEIERSIPRAKRAAEAGGHKYSAPQIRATLHKLDHSEHERFIKHLRAGKTLKSATVASLKK
jgi:hypothetical protein